MLDSVFYDVIIKQRQANLTRLMYSGTKNPTQKNWCDCDNSSGDFRLFNKWRMAYRLDTVATVLQQSEFNSDSDSIMTVLRQYNNIETVK